MGKVKDMAGQRFGKWTALYECGRSHNGAALWWCKCDCGTERAVVGSSLRKGVSKGCGCDRAEIAKKYASSHKTHGGRNDRLYLVWRGMKDRCNNPHSKYYRLYGARGIKICPEWDCDYQAFKDWAYANGYNDSVPKYQCTIDRVDNNAGYCPENCAWKNTKEQSNNRSTNHLLEYNGVTHTISQWAEITGIRQDTIRRRIVVYNWPVARALTEPTHNR